MRILKFKLLFFLLLTVSLHGNSQNNTNMPERTPEQEAVKQTDKLQEAVRLTPEQVRKAYEINLKYARERQLSNKRTEAIERLKNKNEDINKLLNKEQNEQLKFKRYQHSTFEVPATTGSNIVPAGSGYRQVSPAPTSNSTQPQVIRRSTSPTTVAPSGSTLNRSNNSVYTAPRTKDTAPVASPATRTNRTYKSSDKTNSTKNGTRR